MNTWLKSWLKRVSALSIFTLASCAGRIEVEKKDIEVSIKRDDAATVVTLSQNVDLLGYDKKQLDFRITLKYSPVQLRFDDYPNMPELPRPLPLSFAPPNIPSGEIFSFADYGEKLSQQGNIPFQLPFNLRGKKRVSKESLDMLIANNQVEALEQVSLGNVSVQYSTLQAWEVADVKVYHVNAAVKEYYFMSSSGEFLAIGYPHPQSRNALLTKGAKLDKQQVILFRAYFDDNRLKMLSDEMVWQIAQVESIEGLFRFVQGYELQGKRITHFATLQENNFGLGQTFETKSKAQAKILSSSSTSEAESGARYNIHLSGIIGVQK